jgi:hypothetical protein
VKKIWLLEKSEHHRNYVQRIIMGFIRFTILKMTNFYYRDDSIVSIFAMILEGFSAYQFS